tara:strand:- start:1049 stop:1531 length:483 start_codon:yes stop_codon:yes gene_type:complete
LKKNNELQTKITPKQMEEALKILNEACSQMNGEEFGRLCLDKDPHGPSQSWVNENFRRFQDNLGGQLAKTSGDYWPKLAAGLVEFYKQRNEVPYYVLAIDYGNGYEINFGAYNKETVMEELEFQTKMGDYSGAKNAKIITTIDDQRAIDNQINKLNKKER